MKNSTSSVSAGVRRLPQHDLLSRHEVMAALGVSDQTLRRMLALGTFPQPIKFSMKTWRWPRAVVEQAVGLRAAHGETSRRDAT